MRNKFDEQLDLLKTQMIQMGALCEEAIASATKALINGDIELAKKVITTDEDIDHKEKEIESICLKLLLQYQPVARDLRQISSALKMITDMERIGDQAADISEIIMLANIKAANNTSHIADMAKATIKMVTDSIDAYVQQNLKLAKAVIDYDDVVDNLFNDVKADMIRLINEDTENGEFAIDLIMISKYFERIGDHATNIAEWVVFSITGKHVEEEQ
ncbi:MAG TPA: phosphate signaling complex protein PhoU [Fervidobacterium sp.]|jgi:phosphate transport system protein|uniref:Phosphate-specific transport system accessory protein PhoU n=1 Tax=Acetivibrio straminisolvens JCM 21531 TaxID=1294263 RepID=W4V4X0_9FIRM|nr:MULTISPECIES: phosphate signaling complex protein PhoU [Acetivibrio]MCB5253387.1 phosphate signaling complex protein PhoU [Candidatus Cloacimonadota bacterium]MDD3702574.1 phosphate signaling complex protein PhoU [Bacteroidales bacterium]MDR9756885.1 phosphate signaling complex protein PhoU [Thermoanaerobacterales bacterium]HUM44164.1 phosphate signaling complex protein PhoU [Fervidobacterium sp.]GAE88460.1 phosphate transport system regulatory protein PhoU [Acetivibrio straminisolvens JCM 